MNNPELCRAYILHRRAYRETSLLVEALTQDFGRVGLVARGARNARRKSGASRAHFEPFLPVLISWTGRGELFTLTRIEPERGVTPLAGNPLVAGLYLNELLLGLLKRHDPQPEVFFAYDQMLGALRSNNDLEQGLRHFEKRLLDLLGYGLELMQCIDTGRAVESGKRYAYRLNYGPVPLEANQPGDIAIEGSTLLALGTGSQLRGQALKESKALLRAALKTQLGDRTIHSRELWRR